MIDYERHRFGSAGFADERMLHQAELYRAKNGLFIGEDANGRQCYSSQQAAIWLNGGSRSGKGNFIIPWIIDGHFSDHVLLTDYKGQNGSIAQMQVPQGRHVINFMPRGDRPVQAHRINPVSYIRSDSPTLFSDTKRFTLNWLPSSGGKDSYFQETGQRWIEAVGITRTRIAGELTLPRLADDMARFGTLHDEWLALEEHMASMAEPSIQQVVSEIQQMREGGSGDSGGFVGVKSDIAKSFACMSDPQLRAAVSPPFDFCFSELTMPGAPPYLVSIMEAMDKAESSAPVIKSLYTSALTYKMRSVGTSRDQFWLLDECAHSGRWPLAVTLASQTTGYGIRPAFVTQSRAQLDYLAPNASSIIPSNCGTQIFMGVRDYDEAKRVSDMLGTQTIEHEDFLTNENARLANEQAMMRVLNENADPFQAGVEMAQNEAKMVHKVKVPRLVLTPAEVLGLPNGTAIVAMPGTLEHPAFMRHRNYWQRRDLAGRYLADPFHPTAKGDVQVQISFGKQYRRVIREQVPPELSHLPQYQDGTWSYVEGYRPI